MVCFFCDLECSSREEMMDARIRAMNPFSTTI